MYVIPISVPVKEMLSSSLAKKADHSLFFHSQELVCMEHRHLLKACVIENKRTAFLFLVKDVFRKNSNTDLFSKILTTVTVKL